MINENKYSTYCINLRHKLHMIPETGFDLPKTIKVICEELDKLGIKYFENIGKSSIVAVLEGECKTPVIGFRADMDALFIQEENDCDFKSTHQGKMHACGHDSHVAMLLTTLKYLVEEKVKFNCTVKAIFQAAEEGPNSGGKLVCEDELMNDVEAFFAIHVSPQLPCGVMRTRAKEFNASCDDFDVEIIGKSGHAAYPKLAIDPIQMANEVYMKVQEMKTSPEFQNEKLVFTISGFHAGGESNNIIPNSCRLYGTVRTYNKLLKPIIRQRFETIIKDVTSKYGGSYHFTYTDECIPLLNDPEVTNYVIKVIKDILGEDHFITDDFYTMGVDDFAYYCDKARGVMFNLGVGDKDNSGKHNASLHNCRFNPNEEAFISGVKVYINIIKNYLSLVN